MNSFFQKTYGFSWTGDDGGSQSSSRLLRFGQKDITGDDFGGSDFEGSVSAAAEYGRLHVGAECFVRTVPAGLPAGTTQRDISITGNSKSTFEDSVTIGHETLPPGSEVEVELVLLISGTGDARGTNGADTKGQSDLTAIMVLFKGIDPLVVLSYSLGVSAEGTDPSVVGPILQAEDHQDPDHPTFTPSSRIRAKLTVGASYLLQGSMEAKASATASAKVGSEPPSARAKADDGRTAWFNLSPLTPGTTVMTASGASYLLAPPLSISQIAGKLRVSWPDGFPEYRLESSSGVSGTPWSPVEGVSGHSVEVPEPTAPLYFRLHR